MLYVRTISLYRNCIHRCMSNCSAVWCSTWHPCYKIYLLWLLYVPKQLGITQLCVWLNVVYGWIGSVEEIGDMRTIVCQPCYCQLCYQEKWRNYIFFFFTLLSRLQYSGTFLLHKHSLDFIYTSFLFVLWMFQCDGFSKIYMYGLQMLHILMAAQKLNTLLNYTYHFNQTKDAYTLASDNAVKRTR